MMRKRYEYCVTTNHDERRSLAQRDDVEIAMMTTKLMKMGDDDDDVLDYVATSATRCLLLKCVLVPPFWSTKLLIDIA